MNGRLTSVSGLRRRLERRFRRRNVLQRAHIPGRLHPNPRGISAARKPLPHSGRACHGASPPVGRRSVAAGNRHRRVVPRAAPDSCRSNPPVCPLFLQVEHRPARAVVHHGAEAPRGIDSLNSKISSDILPRGNSRESYARLMAHTPVGSAIVRTAGANPMSVQRESGQSRDREMSGVGEPRRKGDPSAPLARGLTPQFDAHLEGGRRAGCSANPGRGRSAVTSRCPGGFRVCDVQRAAGSRGARRSFTAGRLPAPLPTASACSV